MPNRIFQMPNMADFLAERQDDMKNGNMADNIDVVVRDAMKSLQEIIQHQDQNGLCLLKELGFDMEDVPYAKRAIQDLYQIRYYGAYLMENVIAYNVLKVVFRVDNPIIASIGCGCLVDKKAADIMFGAHEYEGFDVVDWQNKAVTDVGCFRHQDIFTTKIRRDTNVIIFPRSIGDLGKRAHEFLAVFDDQTLNSNIIYVVGTYRNNVENGICCDRALLNNVLNTFEQYTSELVYTFDGKQAFLQSKTSATDKGKEYIGSYNPTPDRWSLVDDSFNFIEKLSSNCINNGKGRNCYQKDCDSMNHSPMMKIPHLAFDIFRLVKSDAVA